MIAVRGLKKSYGDLAAVNGVSFDVAAGECFGLLGPNGAGKTTTISVITGLLKPDAGEITVAGKADPTRPEVRAALGATPQSLAVYEELTGEENLAFFGRIHGLGGRQLKARVDWSLDFAGLADRRRDFVSTYSGGMKRRLNIACGLLHEPKVLLMDEPTVGVDPQSRNLIFDRIEALKKDGITILYTTHYMEEAQRLCDRVAIMDHGSVLAEGTVAALVEAHGGHSVVEAEFRGTPPAPDRLPAPAEGGRVRVETHAPLEVVAQLAAAGGEMATLRVEKPNLEDVFLHLTGRRLRD